jgi:hypothetical protein
MPKLIITHDVADVGTWLEGKSERAAAIELLGAHDVVDHVAQDGSNKIAVTAQTDDVDAVLAAIESPTPEMVDAMQRHGVVPPLAVYVER